MKHSILNGFNSFDNNLCRSFVDYPSGQHIIFFHSLSIVTAFFAIVMIILNFHRIIQFHLFPSAAHFQSMQSHHYYWKRYIRVHDCCTVHNYHIQWDDRVAKQWHGYWHKWLHSSFVLMILCGCCDTSHNGFMAKFAKESFTVHLFQSQKKNELWCLICKYALSFALHVIDISRTGAL